MSYSAITQLLAQVIGLDPASTGDTLIERAVRRRMDQCGVQDLNQYSDLVRGCASELEDLIEGVVVPETWFFRDHGPFVFLKEHVRKTRMEGHPRGKLRILSAPCSTGEEPYSIAVTLAEAGIPPETVHIDAVDISKKAIEAAKRGIYGKTSFREERADYPSRHFVREAEGIRISPTITGMVNFYAENLLDPRCLANHEPYHIVFCRNLLIYLNQEGRKSVLSNLERLLRSDGLLFAGHSEVVFFQQCGYSMVDDPRAFACRKPAAQPGRREGRGAATSLRRARPVRIVSQRSRHRGTSPPTHRIPKPPEYRTAGSLLAKARDLADRGLLDEALRVCEELVATQNHDVEAHSLMGLISQASERLAEAEEHFLRALYLDPHHYQSLIHLSLLYELRGEAAKAALYRDRARRVPRAGTGSGPGALV